MTTVGFKMYLSSRERAKVHQLEKEEEEEEEEETSSHHKQTSTYHPRPYQTLLQRSITKHQPNPELSLKQHSTKSALLNRLNPALETPPPRQ